MSDFENDFEQYIKHIDLVQKKEPEKYEFIKEIAGELTDINLSKLVENVALSFEKKKKTYSEFTSKATKEFFINEQIELYTYANHRFKRFGDYANEMFDKYQPILIEALQYWKNEFNNIKALPPQQPETETEQEQQTENDFTLSTIEDWLFEFKEVMSKADYKILVSALIKYFDTGIFPIISKPIQINGRPNKKLFGWALNRIFEAKGKGVELELLQFAKQNISLFTDVSFDKNNFLKSNLYKYFTTKTK